MKEKSTKQSFWELVRFALMVLAIVIPVRIFVAEPFVVSGSSMVPAFEDKNYLIVDKISYRLGDPKRNDVVVFRPPVDSKKFYIKRIIGLPSEILDIKGSIMIITNLEYPQGFKLDEPYVKNVANNVAHFELKDDEYFVMGDNRNASSDSRSWGTLKRKLITGRAFLRLLPISNIDIWPGYYQQQADSALGSR
ncbi:MAG: signal peptidase I, bacterial type [Parcubacteria group bacterium Gr01-1014_24]|nr:MAG: signal peptidase I, bacterial type [Parcubacteria group bacterium Gr01-1014_24]